MRRPWSSDLAPLLLFLVGGAATIGLLMLFAYAPDARNLSSAGNDALSRSAVGYAGLDRLLQMSGIPTELDRGVAAGQSTRPSLTILTPVLGVTAANWRDYQEQGAVLIILPKWVVVPMPLHNGWVMKASAYSPAMLSVLMAPVARRLPITQWPGDRKEATLEVAPPLVGLPPMLPAAIEQLQTFGDGTGAPLLWLTASDGSQSAQPRNVIVLTRIRGGDKPIYVLSEPDLMNNQGLSDEVTAKAALAIIRSLRRGGGPVRLDVTLNGLGHQRNLFQALFEPPFRGATIAAFLAALLMGLHALARFGAPLRTVPPYARGKKALADNTAALVRMMGREGGMAERYVHSARDLVLARFGARRRRTTLEQEALIAALEGETGGSEYDQIATAAAAAKTGGDLLQIARQAFAWRIKISGEHQ